MPSTDLLPVLAIGFGALALLCIVVVRVDAALAHAQRARRAADRWLGPAVMPAALIGSIACLLAVLSLIELVSL